MALPDLGKHFPAPRLGIDFGSQAFSENRDGLLRDAAALLFGLTDQEPIKVFGNIPDL